MGIFKDLDITGRLAYKLCDLSLPNSLRLEAAFSALLTTPRASGCFGLRPLYGKGRGAGMYRYV